MYNKYEWQSRPNVKKRVIFTDAQKVSYRMITRLFQYARLIHSTQYQYPFITRTGSTRS
jgi:hypothetical protein